MNEYGDRKIDMNKLAILLGSTKLSFASPERMDKYLGVKQGSVSPLCVLNDENHEAHKDLLNHPNIQVSRIDLNDVADHSFKYCSKCGEKNEKAANVCSRCGNML